MRDGALEGTVRSEHDAIRTRRSARVNLPRVQDGELVIGTGVWERKTLIILVLVRVAAGRIAIIQIGAALLHSGIDIALIVASGAAGVCTGFALPALDAHRHGHTCKN